MAKLLLISGLLLYYVPVLGQIPDSTQINSAVVVAPNYFMVLDKPGKVHRIRFYTGNKITFKLHGEKQRYHGQITQIKQHSLVLWDTEIPLRDIEKIRMNKPGGALDGLNFLGRLLQGAGGLFTLVGLSNYALGVESGEHSQEFLKYSVSALTVGYAINRFSRQRTYKINQNRRLKTIEQFW